MVINLAQDESSGSAQLELVSSTRFVCAHFDFRCPTVTSPSMAVTPVILMTSPLASVSLTLGRLVLN